MAPSFLCLDKVVYSRVSLLQCKLQHSRSKEMKKSIATLATIPLLFAVGCSAEPERVVSEPVPTVTVTASPTPEPEPEVTLEEPEVSTETYEEPTGPSATSGEGIMSDEFFVNFVFTEQPSAERYFTEDQVVEMALSVCGALDRGVSWGDVILVIASESEGDILESASFIAGAGVSNYCPEYEDEVMDF